MFAAEVGGESIGRAARLGAGLANLARGLEARGVEMDTRQETDYVIETVHELVQKLRGAGWRR